jgi:hypothetical protein
MVFSILKQRATQGSVCSFNRKKIAQDSCFIDKKTEGKKSRDIVPLSKSEKAPCFPSPLDSAEQGLG